jgi:hypothetical protein
VPAALVSQSEPIPAFNSWTRIGIETLVDHNASLLNDVARRTLECVKLPARAPPLSRADEVGPVLDQANPAEPESLPIEETDPDFDIESTLDLEDRGILFRNLIDQRACGLGVREVDRIDLGEARRVGG